MFFCVSRAFLVVLGGYYCSRWFLGILSGSRRFMVLIGGSWWFLVVLGCSW